MLVRWNELPELMRSDIVRIYYDILSKKKISLFAKRIFDFFTALIMLILLTPLMLVISLMIKIDSPGSVFYRQERITKYGKSFMIHKFRTMFSGSDKTGLDVTISNDSRITRVGMFLRKYRLDEIPQLFDVISGSMSFVGARPEVPKYVEKYTDEMMSTLLLPAGITSYASIKYRDEAQFLYGTIDVDAVYMNDIIPEKMKYNLEYIRCFNFLYDIKLMFLTFLAIIRSSDDKSITLSETNKEINKD